VLTDGRVGWLVGFQKARVSPPKMVEDGRWEGMCVQEGGGG
jgi:hypothetical protein